MGFRVKVWGLGFRVWGLGFRVWGSGFGAWCVYTDVYSVRAVGTPFTPGTGAHPLIACLRQHVVLPQPPQLFSIRV